MQIKKIVIIGPESTGKSTLCSELADHYATSWVPEFAREYLLANGTEYTLGDLSIIANGQLTMEDAYASKIEATKPVKNGPEAPLLFIDTDMYVMKTWSEFVFDACDNRILNQIVSRRYDLYLLCNTDLPWQADALREYPDFETRETLFEHYRESMINQPVPWLIISGERNQRLEMAIQAVDAILKKSANQEESF